MVGGKGAPSSTSVVVVKPRPKARKKHHEQTAPSIFDVNKWHAPASPPERRRATTRDTTPIVTEHTRGQADRTPVNADPREVRDRLLIARRAAAQYGMGKPTPLSHADREYIRTHPAEHAPLLLKLIGYNLGAALPGVGPTASLQHRSRVQAEGFDQAILSSTAKQLYEEGRHPIRSFEHHPVTTSVDALTLLAGGYGAFAKGAQALRAGSAAEKGSRIAEASAALRRPTTVAEAFPRLVRDPAGRRGVHAYGVHHQNPLESPSLLMGSLQHAGDRLSELAPGAWGVGAEARARRLYRLNAYKERLRQDNDLLGLEEAARKLRGKAGRVTPREMAYTAIARYGHMGDRGAELVAKERDQKLALAAASSGRARKFASKRARLLDKAIEHVRNPDEELLTALREGRRVSHKTTAQKIMRGELSAQAAIDAENMHMQFLHGAERLEPTDARLGKATKAERRAAEQLAQAEADAEKSRQRLKAKPEYTGAQRKRLGLKSEKLAAREPVLAERIKELRAQINATPQGTTDELQRRLQALNTKWEGLVDKIAGQTRDAKVKGTQTEQRWLNSQTKKGETAPNAAEMYRQQAEQEAFAFMEKNRHLPVVQGWQAHLDEAGRIGDELAAREQRAGGLFAEAPPKGTLHPHLPTTEAALKEELRRTRMEHSRIKGLTMKLPVGTPDAQGLRESLRVEEKILRGLQGEWDAPAADLLAERAGHYARLRQGTGAQKALRETTRTGVPVSDEPLSVEGIVELRAKIAQLDEQIKEARGESSAELRDQREVVNKMRSELRKLTRRRAHISEIHSGEYPVAMTEGGDLVRPKGADKHDLKLIKVRLAKEKLERIRSRNAELMTPTGRVSPAHMLPAHKTAKRATKALKAALKEKGLTLEDAGIRRIVNTRDMTGDEMVGGGWGIEGGLGETVHVTDEPARVAAMLHKGEPIAAGREGDLGAAGLHASDAPNLWRSRSRAKWGFAKHLTSEERNRLADELDAHLSHPSRRRELTPSEIGYAKRNVESFRGGNNDALAVLANQPYNVPVADPEYLGKLGITPGAQPHDVPVHYQGSFAELSRRAKPEVIEALKAAGFDGAYTRASMGTNPELVIWNNRAVKKFSDYEQVLPHQMKAGPEGFFAGTDRPRLSPRQRATAAATGGRRTSLSAPRERVYPSTGKLYKEGRERVGPSTTIREAIRENRFASRQKIHDDALRMSIPYEGNSHLFDPEKHTLFDTYANTPASELPFGEKKRAAAEKRAALELPEELSGEDALNTGKVLDYLRQEHDVWRKGTFPSLEELHPARAESMDGLRIIDKKLAQAMTDVPELSRSNSRVLRAVGDVFDFSNRVNRAGLIYLNFPSYGIVQGLGNRAFLALQQGPFAYKTIGVYRNRLRDLEPETLRNIDREVGGGAAHALAHEGRTVGPMTKLADFQNMLADRGPRRTAWIHEADRMGFKTKDEIEALLTHEDLRPQLNVVSERAQQAMVKFERMPSDARRIIGRAIFIAPWLEGSTRWLGRAVVDHPLTFAAAMHIRQKIIDHQEKVLGRGKQVTGSFIPVKVKAPGFLPRQVRGAIDSVLPGETTRDGLTLLSGLNLDAASPIGSGVDVLKTGAETLGLTAPPQHGGSRLLGKVQPTYQALLAAGLHQDLYSGYKYPSKRSFGSILAEQLGASTEHPSFPLAQTLAQSPAGRKLGLGYDAKLDTQHPDKLPVYEQDKGWGGAIRRQLFGSARPRNVIEQSIGARGEKLDRANAGPHELARLNVKAAIEDGRKARNELSAAAQRYGLTHADELPPAVNQAIHLRTLRYVNYAQHGLIIGGKHGATQEQLLRADIDYLVKEGKLNEAQQAAGLAWLAAGRSSRQIEGLRSKLGAAFFGSTVLSNTRRAIHQAADAQGR